MITLEPFPYLHQISEEQSFYHTLGAVTSGASLDQQTVVVEGEGHISLANIGRYQHELNTSTATETLSRIVHLDFVAFNNLLIQLRAIDPKKASIVHSECQKFIKDLIDKWDAKPWLQYYADVKQCIIREADQLQSGIPDGDGIAAKMIWTAGVGALATLFHTLSVDTNNSRKITFIQNPPEEIADFIVANFRDDNGNFFERASVLKYLLDPNKKAKKNAADLGHTRKESFNQGR